jgi:thymidylate kinase
MTDYQLNAVENVEANLRAGRHVVLDRHWPSEHCYGSHLRKETMIDVNPVRQALTELDPTYIFCMDQDGANAAADRHELHLDPAHPYKREDFVAIYQNYRDLITGMREGGEPVHVRRFLVDPDTRKRVESDRDFIGDIRAKAARRKEQAQ